MQMKEYGCCLRYQLQPIYYKLLNLPVTADLLQITKHSEI